MYQANEIQTCVWADQNHSIEETQLTLESVGAVSREMDELIAFLYNRDDLTEANQIPSLQELRARFPKILFHLIDAGHENAYAYQVLEYDNRTKMHNFTNYKGLVIGDWADQLSRDAIVTAYTYPHQSGLPRLSVVTKSSASSRRYTHLIWPLRKKGEITQLLVAARYQDVIVPTGIYEGGTQIGPNEIGFPFIRRGGEIFRSVKAKLRTGMAVYSEGEPISMQVRQIMGDNKINALVY